MKLNAVLLALVLIALLLRAGAQAPAGPPPLAAPGTLAPLVELDGTSDLPLKMVLKNSSEHSLRYLPGIREGQVADVELSLWSGGQRVPRRGPTVAPPVLVPANVRELKAGEELVLVWKLREEYGKLNAGRYVATVRFDSVGENLAAIGITPMQIEQSLYLEIK